MTTGAAQPARWREGWQAVLPAFATAKVLTLVAVVLAVEHNFAQLTWASLRDAFTHWDSVSYLDIAGHGYPTRLDYHDAFLPGYPLLVKGASLLTRDLVSAGVLVSALAELAALLFVHELVRRERDGKTAQFAVWAVALAPLGFFFSGVYTESAFIAGAALSLLLMRAGNMRGASLAAACAVAMRLTGVVLLPVIAVEMARQKRLRADARWLALVPMPLLFFAAYTYAHSGDFLALAHAESLPSFGEAAAWPWDGLRATWATAATATDATNRSIFIRETVAGLLGFAVVVVAWLDARSPRSIALYCTLVWLMAVSLTFWRSVPRYDLALFPAVVVVADVTARAPVLRPLLVAASAALLGWGAFTFAQGQWIG